MGSDQGRRGLGGLEPWRKPGGLLGRPRAQEPPAQGRRVGPRPLLTGVPLQPHSKGPSPTHSSPSRSRQFVILTPVSLHPCRNHPPTMSDEEV